MSSWGCSSFLPGRAEPGPLHLQRQICSFRQGAEAMPLGILPDTRQAWPPNVPPGPSRSGAPARTPGPRRSHFFLYK